MPLGSVLHLHTIIFLPLGTFSLEQKCEAGRGRLGSQGIWLIQRLTHERLIRKYFCSWHKWKGWVTRKDRAEEEVNWWWNLRWTWAYLWTEVPTSRQGRVVAGEREWNLNKNSPSSFKLSTNSTRALPGMSNTQVTFALLRLPPNLGSLSVTVRLSGLCSKLFHFSFSQPYSIVLCPVLYR